MDNLDRTNVAQSAIAKWMLNRQLRDIGVFQEHESVDSHDGFMNDFRNSKLPEPYCYDRFLPWYYSVRFIYISASRLLSAVSSSALIGK